MKIVDRLEGDVAVVEEGDLFVRLPLSILPADVREGDVLAKENGRYTVDVDATEKRKQMLAERFARLTQKKDTEDRHG